MHFIGCLNIRFRKIASLFLSLLMLSASMLDAKASVLSYMPEPGHTLARTVDFKTLNLQGLELNPQNPFQLKFIVDQGDDNILCDEIYKRELKRLVSYFLSALTIPQEELWVNLSPYEENRVMDYDLSQTNLGRDMLAQDYILKQLSASLTHPKSEFGRNYWKEQVGTSPAVSSNDLSKIWIKPSKAELYVDSAKVMLGQAQLKVETENDAMNSTLIAEIEAEINSGKHFARLRQVYNATLLAYWFKQTLLNSFFAHQYFDRSKIKGVDFNDNLIREKVFKQYLTAFEQGAYDLTVKSKNLKNGRLEKKRYVCGGIDLSGSSSIEYKPFNKEQGDEQYHEFYIKLVQEKKEKFEKLNEKKRVILEQLGPRLINIDGVVEHVVPAHLDIDDFENEPILSGSTAKVYRELEGVYKVMRHDSQFNDKVVNEIRILHKLSHTEFINEINNLEAIGLTTENVPYLRLSTILDSRPLDLNHSNMSVSDKLRLLSKIAKVYKKLIESGVIHGDIKADNVLLNDEGDFLIIDFGMSIDLEDPKYSEKYVESPAYYEQQDVKDFAHMTKDMFFDWQGNSLIIEDEAVAGQFYAMLERMWFSRAENKINTFDDVVEVLEAFLASSSLKQDDNYGGVDLSKQNNVFNVVGAFSYSDDWSSYKLDPEFAGFSFEIQYFTK